MSRGFSVPAPHVVAEAIDGELIILNLVEGTYHATDGIGADLWNLVASGLNEDQIITECERQWPGETSVAATIGSFLQLLVDRGLLLAADERPPALENGATLRTPTWQPPALNSYDDLADMIQLDPIHDVTETGWPNAASVL